MSAIIIPSSTAPSTTTHTFQVETPAGRLAQISVEAHPDLSADVVLDDLRRADISRVLAAPAEPKTPAQVAGDTFIGLLLTLLLAGILFVCVDVFGGIALVVAAVLLLVPLAAWAAAKRVQKKA